MLSAPSTFQLLTRVYMGTWIKWFGGTGRREVVDYRHSRVGRIGITKTGDMP